MLAVSPLAAFSRTAGNPLFLNVFPFHREEQDAIYTSKKTKPTVNAGDRIRFLPELIIDGFTAIPDGSLSFFNHLILNVY